jgi:hypothetical protein
VVSETTGKRIPKELAMDEQGLDATGGAQAPEEAHATGGDEALSRARPEFSDPEKWHDLAERGTPRNG